jgi:CHAT domain-containing protein
LAELAALPAQITFANLSGCRTGSWPITADRGRFGIAGLFARRGARWVVASRSPLNDQLAGQFNRIFYRELAQGQTVPQAYAQALAWVRQQVPAASWSSFFLLQGSEGGKIGSP